MLTLNKITTLFVRVASLTAWWAGFLLQLVGFFSAICCFGGSYSGDGTDYPVVVQLGNVFLFPLLFYGRFLQLLPFLRKL